MPTASLVRRFLLRSQSVDVLPSAAGKSRSLCHPRRANYSSVATSADRVNNGEDDGGRKGKWLTLPPFSETLDGASLGKDIVSKEGQRTATSTAALKWVARCCPQLPKSLVLKLFRLRQVRKESSNVTSTDPGVRALDRRIKRISAKDQMEFGDRLLLPVTVQVFPSENAKCLCSEEELGFLHSIVLHKDPAILVVNKPPGMPVQGGIGIKRSLDQFAGTYLRYDYSELPRLVHRLDRDSSGILVMGRSQLSTTVLHSIFREKTFGARSIEQESERRFLQRRYWALVLGCPRRQKGVISVPLGKVVMDDGRSERITVVDNVQSVPSQHAITEYKVIDSSSHGYTWLELTPLTGRKHQLRVHCAEVLGTPIVGDYKYGWQAHKKWKPLEGDGATGKPFGGKTSAPFGLDLESGSIYEKQPGLHLHCREMVLPDVSYAIRRAKSFTGCDFADVKSLDLVAPLPLHMQKSWDVLSS